MLPRLPLLVDHDDELDHALVLSLIWDPVCNHNCKHGGAIPDSHRTRVHCTAARARQVRVCHKHPFAVPAGLDERGGVAAAGVQSAGNAGRRVRAGREDCGLQAVQ